jgi:hypothetical protein
MKSPTKERTKMSPYKGPQQIFDLISANCGGELVRRLAHEHPIALALLLAFQQQRLIKGGSTRLKYFVSRFSCKLFTVTFSDDRRCGFCALCAGMLGQARVFG